MVEMDDVVMHRVGQDDHVADVLRVDRQLELQGILDRTHRCQSMHRRAHAADALGDGPGVARVATDQDVLRATPHLPRGPSLLHFVAIDLDIDPQVAFDPRDRINRDSSRHLVVC
ncbi:MAG: hypothetical protein AW07_03522 [Candidatus Accumulibacter sp. SK-11]|nr:MAG: hypothetical protein AW07_03522 [Candidatus Accumulibacter sp. SK-11]